MVLVSQVLLNYLETFKFADNTSSILSKDHVFHCFWKTLS